VTVEFIITIDPILESIKDVVDELEPGPIPDPPFEVEEVLAVP
jgi:hypothetical protein